MRVLYDRVAAIDVHKDMVKVAIRVPGAKRGTRKTDAKDAIRLLDLYECGLLSGSYMPSEDLREVRDLARYRMKTVQARTSEIQRSRAGHRGLAGGDGLAVAAAVGAFGQAAAGPFDLADMDFAFIGVGGDSEQGDVGGGGVQDQGDRLGFGVAAGQDQDPGAVDLGPGLAAHQARKPGGEGARRGRVAPDDSNGDSNRSGQRLPAATDGPGQRPFIRLPRAIKVTPAGRSRSSGSWDTAGT